MANIKLPTRFNQAQAAAGKWFKITDEFDQNYGSFKCSLFDKTSASYRLAHKRWIEENKKALETDKLSGDQLAFKIFIDICLHDWKDIPTDDGKQFSATQMKTHCTQRACGGCRWQRTALDLTFKLVDGGVAHPYFEGHDTARVHASNFEVVWREWICGAQYLGC